MANNRVKVSVPITDFLNDKKLIATAKTINQKYDDACGMAQKATSLMMEVGIKLIEARTMFPGDKEFGKWRESNISFSSRHCTRLMKIASEFGDNQNAHLLPLSTLGELVPAGMKLRDEIIQKVKNGETITVKEVRSKVQASKPILATKPVSGDDTPLVKAGINENPLHRPSPPPFVETKPVSTDPIEIRTTSDIELPLQIRLKNCNDPFVILGLTPFFDCTYNQEVLTILVEYYSKQNLTTAEQRKLKWAYEKAFDMIAPAAEPDFKFTMSE